MADRKKIEVTFTGKDKLTRVAKKVSGTVKGITESLNKFVFSVQGLLTGAVAGAIGTFFTNLTRKSENLRASLETVTQSSEETDKILKLLERNAGKLNSTVGALGEAWIKLVNAGIDPSIERLEAFLNVAAANPGKNLDQFVEAVADALRGEFERLKEFGISASKQGDQVEFTFRNVATTVKNTSEEIGKYLEDLGRVQFAGGIARQAETIDGAFLRLENSLNRLGKTINEGGGVGDNIREWINEIAALVDLANDATKPDSLESLAEELDKLQRGVAGFGEDNAGRQSRIAVIKQEIATLLVEADGPDGLRQKLILLDQWMQQVEVEAANLRTQISEIESTPRIRDTEDNLRPLLTLNEKLDAANRRLGSLGKERDAILEQLADKELDFGKDVDSATAGLDKILKRRADVLKDYVDDTKDVAREFDALAKSLDRIGEAGKGVSLKSVNNELLSIRQFLDAGDLSGASSAIEQTTQQVEALIAARARFAELNKKAAAEGLSDEEAAEVANLRQQWVGSEQAIKAVILQLQALKQEVIDRETKVELLDVEKEKKSAEQIKAEVGKLNPTMKLGVDLAPVKEAIRQAEQGGEFESILRMRVQVSVDGVPEYGDGQPIPDAIIERESDKRGYRL